MGSIVAEIADKIASAGGGERSELEVRGGVGADGGGILTLSTSELTVVDGDKLGRIDFQAPLETGTDAILVGASIYAEADDTFAADNNSTELVFAVGASEAAAEKMRLTHDGELGIGVTTPASLLHVAGTVQVGVDDTGHDVIFYGASAGALMQWDESADVLIVRGATADHATTSAGRIVLQTNQAAVADNDIIGRLDFQASNETGADALLVSASIYAEAEETFDATTNGTALVFAVGDGAAAAEVARFDHDGQFGIGVAPNAQLTVEGTIKLKEQSAAVADTAAYGQLWVDDAANSPLYFTNDAGDDIQITSGSGLALTGAGSLVHLLTANLPTGAGTTGTTFDNFVDSDYTSYRVIIRNVQPATDATEIRLVLNANSDQSLITAAAYWSAISGYHSDAGDYNLGLESAGYVRLFPNVGTANVECANADLLLTGLNTSASSTLFTGSIGWQHGSSYIIAGAFAGGFTNSPQTADSGFTLQTTTGNFATGSISVYGIKTS
jgi:hypothetical protein